MPYTAQKPSPKESSEQLRARIPGWGADLDPADRPSVPREQFDPNLSGAHWEFPERQPEKWPRERSIEHAFLTPVFGTSCPPRGVSGAIRRWSYAKYSEGRAAHWLLLLAADRVDTFGQAVDVPTGQAALLSTGLLTLLAVRGERTYLAAGFVRPAVLQRVAADLARSTG